MPRVVSFIALLTVVLLVGAVFFRVMAQFLVPLFLACVLLVVFQPLHRWVSARLAKQPRISAMITTILIVLIVLVPAVWLGWNAYVECQKLLQPMADGSESVLTRKLNDLATNPQVKKLLERFKEYTNESLQTGELVSKATSLAGPWLLSGVQTVFGMLIGLIIMVVALYYFFADGPAMIHGMMQLSPIDRRYEYELLARFSEISRSVVVATMASAIVQGLLAGVGYYFVLSHDAPIFLLTAITIVAAIVPFVGSAIIWVPVCLGFYALGGKWELAVALAVYCVVVVSMVDNLVKPFILHGQANLHPLLALLSILGGASVLGPIGILVGPMLVSFLQALLLMLRKELERWGDPTTKSMTMMSPAAVALEKSIEAAVEEIAEEKLAKPAPPKPSKGAGSKKKGRRA